MVYISIGLGIVAIAIATIFYYRKIRRVNVMSFRESLDLTELPIVTFLIQGKKMNFLLDTGCNLSAINKDSANQLGIFPVGDIKSTLYGIEGICQECPLCTVELEYKNKIYKETFQLLDLTKAFNCIKKSSGVTVSGILGTSFFQTYKYVLDFNELIAYSKS